MTLPTPINVSLYDFARAFRFGENPIFNFRVLPPKLKDAPRPTKEDLEPFARAQVPYFAWLQSVLEPYGVQSKPFKENLALSLLNDTKNPIIRKLVRTNAGTDARAIYFVVNQGGQTKEEISQATAFYIEYDDLPLEDQYAKVMALPIVPHIIVKTKSSLHCYWLAAETTTLDQWESVQRTLIVYANSDPTIKDLPRVMRVPGFDHTTFDFAIQQVSRVPVQVLKFDVLERLTSDRMLAMLAGLGQPAVSKVEFDQWLKARNATNKQRVKVRKERERKGQGAERLYTGEPPEDLQQRYNDICNKVQIVGPSGDSVRAICPCCEDPSPSLIIGLTADKILMSDHAGCTFAELCESVGIEQKHCFAHKKNESAPGREPAYAEQLIELAESADFFYSVEEDVTYATFEVNGHHETYRLSSKPFKQYLARRFYLKTKKVPGSEAIQNALTVLDGKARFDGKQIPVFLRLAACDGKIYWDLSNKDWRIVEISAQEWRVIESKDAPIRFRRTKGMLALPDPVIGGSLDTLKTLINYPDDSAWTLHSAWLVAALRANARAFPILVINGEQGSAKSTACKFSRRLIDPNVADLRPKPREERDLFIAARNGWVCGFDNMSGISKELSDAICQLATGAGWGARELYSDEDETLFQVARPVVINGIDNLAEKADLIDRSIFTEMPPLPDEGRIDDDKLWALFDTERPKLIGALADRVSTALRELPNVQLAKKPRMADFAMWGTAAAIGKNGDFLEVYNANRVQANDLALQANEFAEMVIGWFLTKGNSFTVNFADLLAELEYTYREKEAAKESIKAGKAIKPEKVKLPKWWPASERKLTNELLRCAPNLRREGIEIKDAGKHPRTRKAQRTFLRVEENEAVMKASHASQASHDPLIVDDRELESAKDVRSLCEASDPYPDDERSFEDESFADPSHKLRRGNNFPGNGLHAGAKDTKDAKLSIQRYSDEGDEEEAIMVRDTLLCLRHGAPFERGRCEFGCARETAERARQ